MGERPAAELPGITRRQALQVAVASAALAVLGPMPSARAATPQAAAGDVPATAASVLRSYVATLVPGPADDPAGAPGAVEAGGVEAILAHAPYVVPLLTADLTTAALAAHRRPFPALPYRQREAIVAQAFTAGGYRSTYHLIALALGAGAFYADFYGPERGWVGARHLGYPGPSEGYLGTYTDRTGHGQPQRDAVPA